MAQAKGNKAKGRQSSRNAAYYKTQFEVTKANKKRRAAARQRKANSTGAILRRGHRLQTELAKQAAKVAKVKA
jgi:hypothetical protein